MTTEAVRAMPETTMIAVEHVRKSFGPVPVLKDISLSVPKGGVLSLIGPSGSGKSTLLRCLNLLTIPCEGTIRIGSHAMRFGPDHRMPRDRDLAAFRSTVGMVFQNFNLFPHMSVVQNVMEGPVTVLGRGGTRPGTSPSGSSTRSACARRPTPIPTGSPGDRSSGSPSRGRWRCSRR